MGLKTPLILSFLSVIIKKLLPTDLVIRQHNQLTNNNMTTTTATNRIWAASRHCRI